VAKIEAVLVFRTSLNVTGATNSLKKIILVNVPCQNW